MTSTITFISNGQINGRSAYIYFDGDLTLQIFWTQNYWLFQSDLFNSIFFEVSTCYANTLEPPCSSMFYWLSGEGCDLSPAPIIGGPSCSTAIIVPIELIRFDAERKENAVQVSWLSALEKNVLGYELQRSESGTNWESIAQIAPQQEGSGPWAYIYKDEEAPATLLYYRLVWVDADGETNYSKSVNVQPQGVRPVRLFPNPAKDFLRVVRSPNDTESAWTISVYNALGQCIQHQMLAGSTTELTTASWPSGAYVVEVLDENRNCYRERILKN